MEKNARPADRLSSVVTAWRARPVVVGMLLAALAACNWAFKPTFPKDQLVEKVAGILRHDYRIEAEVRQAADSLQIFTWRVGLVRAGKTELKPEAAEVLQNLLLTGTRAALSTDAKLQFIEIRMVDMLTGTAVTVHRYVPDIKDSIYQKMGDEEYFNRLVLDIEPEGQPWLATGKPIWTEPLTFPDFLALQIASRAKRNSQLGLNVHADLSEAHTLGMIVDNWQDIAEQGQDKQTEVQELIHTTARKVVSSYGFRGFRGVVLKDGQGLPLRSWPL